MRAAFKTASLTLVLLALLDVTVAVALSWSERTGRFGSLVDFFEYGRSVPGKHARWEADPDIAGNLYDIGWRSASVERSRDSFEAEQENAGPMIREYGMSFTINIRNQALDLRPGLGWDSHAGPAGSPNYTFALYQDDRENRRAGDVVVLGILSSVVPAMATHSNQTRVFEQPAPMTYPIYFPDGADGIARVDPLVTTPAQHRALATDPESRAAWYNQLAQNDAYFSRTTFGYTWLDTSPFARLVRRALANSHLDAVDRAIMTEDAYPFETVLPRIVTDFAKSARADGQTPIVILVQTNGPFDPDILSLTRETLEAEGIPYLATAEIFDPADRSGRAPDNHYSAEVDRMFAQRFLEILDELE